ncbi:unnamed protein product [Mytilus coruscus]|uniref:Uncharacterized protein n=1 Tax=Mytilus coruscus TaxID=42192 RepID=A0A6J8BUZ7_MYTCO|nr:unnamed protein product [Mytilus coruscus]
MLHCKNNGLSVITGKNKGSQFGNFGENCDERPIHLKEADAIIKAIKSLDSVVCNHDLDILTDNKSVIVLWVGKSGSVENLISYLTDIFETVGRGRTWNAALNVGNPAASETVKAYLKAFQEEQATAHIVPKQTKVRSIAVYISRELKRSDLSLRERFVLQRD